MTLYSLFAQADVNPELNINAPVGFWAELRDSLSRLQIEQSWVITGSVVVALLAALLVFVYNSRAGVIARATTKEAVRQPLFLLLLLIALFLNLLNTFVPFFSMGDDVKMLMDCGMATILICGLLLAVWTASTSVADEIEGKTAMTLLSKPINRRQFVVGKFLGILQAVGLFMTPVVIALLLLIFYKVGYDARESGREIVMDDRVQTTLYIIPNLMLVFLEIAVLTAVSVAISTRLPMMLNMVICFTIFVVGNLTPILVMTGVLQLELVEFMARLIATALPSLEIFNTQAAIATGRVVPPEYLGMATLYCLGYSSAAILLAFILFEDRDLA